MHVHELTGDVTGVMRACGNDVIAAHAVNNESCRFSCNTVECVAGVSQVPRRTFFGSLERTHGDTHGSQNSEIDYKLQVHNII